MAESKLIDIEFVYNSMHAVHPNKMLCEIKNENWEQFYNTSCKNEAFRRLRR